VRKEPAGRPKRRQEAPKRAPRAPKMSPKGSKIGSGKGLIQCWEETSEKPQNRRPSRVKTVILEARKVENEQKIRRKVDSEPF